MSGNTKQLSISDSNRFLALFLIGAFLMLMAKLLLSVNQIVVTLPPAIIMALYFTQLTRGHHPTNRPERAGDNIYYLGFLFTLVSLALALYEFGVNADDKTRLIADFAIALSTTILGVLGRVWLTQGDKDIDEYEKEAKRYVSDAIDELRADLELSRETMSDFSSVTRQVLEESRDEQKKQLEQDREEFERHFTESLGKMSAVLTETVSKGSENLSSELERLTTNVAEQVSIFTSSMKTTNSSSKVLSTSLKKVAKSVESIPDLDVLLTEKVEGIVLPLESATERMVSILDKQTAWAKESAAGVSNVVGTLVTLGESIDAVGESSKASLAKIQAPVDHVADRLSMLQDALTRITSQVEGMQAFTGILDQVPQQLARSVESIHSMGRVIGESTEKVSSTLNTFNIDMDIARKTQLEAVSLEAVKLRQLVDDRDRLVTALSGANQEIEKNVLRLRNQLGDVSEALIGTAQFIRKEADTIS